MESGAALDVDNTFPIRRIVVMLSSAMTTSLLMTSRKPRRRSTPLALCVVIAFSILPLTGRSASAASAWLLDSGDGQAPANLSASRLAPLTRTWAPDDLRSLGVGGHRVGAEFRLRYLTWQNVYGPGAGIDPGEQAFKLRSRVSLEYRRSECLRLFALVTNEATQRLGFEDRDASVGELVFENLYFEALQPWGLPLGIRAGRQDLFYGDGFLVAEGGPLDESRTRYVNGVVLTSEIPLWAFDIFALKNPRRDNYLPRINNQHTPLLEADEFAWGVMARRAPRTGTDLGYTLEPYYIYKEESNAGKKARIHTGGARLGFARGPASISGEAAYQGGRAPERDYPKPIDQVLSGPQAISAFAGHARLKIRLALPVPVDVGAGYVFLSGDELETRNKFEGWNPVLGRWPIWSEVVGLALPYESYAQTTNQTLSYWQNLSAPFVALAYRGRLLGLEANWMWLGAAQPLPTLARLENPQLGGATDRGRLYTVGLSWNLPGLVEGHMIYERFTPGDFYPVVTIWDDADPLRFEPRRAEYFRLELTRSF